MKTRAEIYDKVAEHLLNQGEKSLINGEVFQGASMRCGYRSPEGLKCAVGVLIPDWLYDEALEHNGSDTPIVRSALKKAGVPGDDDTRMMLQCLQELHDTESPEDWPILLEQIRQRFFGERVVSAWDKFFYFGLGAVIALSFTFGLSQLVRVLSKRRGWHPGWTCSKCGAPAPGTFLPVRICVRCGHEEKP